MSLVSNLLVIILIVCLSCGMMTCVNATASQCSRPSSSSTASKRSASALASSFDFSQDLIDSEGSLDHEDIDVSTLAATTLFSFRSLSRKAQENVKMAPEHFTGKTGPLGSKIQNRIMKFTGYDSTPCVACRLNCLDAIPVFGSIFQTCDSQYYYYGCQKESPCHTLMDGSVVLETAVGICLERNNCRLVSSLADLQATKRSIFRRYVPSVDEVKKGVVSRVHQYVDNYNSRPIIAFKNKFGFGRK